MKTIFLAVTATTALAAAAPAAAQYSQPYQTQPYQTPYQAPYSTQYQTNTYGNANMDTRLARLDARIQAGVQAGTIDRREERNLRYQLNEINRLQYQYSRNGLSQTERVDLQQRLRTFRDQLARADGGPMGYGAYGSNGYGTNAYGTSGYGTNGYATANNGYYGQGGPYEEAYCDNSERGGVGGLIDSIFGGGSARADNCYGLQVGSRVSGNLGAVPYQYRNQYRDSGSYYYRSDGRQIYQIDARTNTVARVYSIDR